MAEIYGLYSGRDGKVRYVGQTLGTHDVRFKEHQRIGSDHVIRPVYQWIRGEWGAGYPVQCALLESCGSEERHEIERQWISKFPNLLNERKRGYYWRQCKPPVIPKSETTGHDLFSISMAIAAFTIGVTWIDIPFSSTQGRIGNGSLVTARRAGMAKFGSLTSRGVANKGKAQTGTALLLDA